MSREELTAPPPTNTPMELFLLLSLLAAEPASRAAVVVELFTSEGCSSCPPADNLLIRLEKDQSVAGAEIIALSEHVDYWNDIGWRDPFSSSLFTLRQQRYASALRGRGPYTPQMIVDGAEEFVGSDPFHAADAIARAAAKPKARVQLQCDGAAVRINVDSLPPGVRDAEVMLAITEDGLASDVRAGENRGRQMRHASVVRSLDPAGRVANGSFSAKRSLKLNASWNRSSLSAVALVQDAKSMRIAGAAKLRLSACPL